MRKYLMSDPIPTPPAKLKVTGLGRAAQKLQAAKDKAAYVKTGAKPAPGASASSFKAKETFANTKKSTFQRKAV